MRRTFLAVIAALAMPASTLGWPTLAAAAPPLTGPDSGAAIADAAAAAMMTALQRDLGLTRDEARARPAREEQAGNIEATLRRNLGASFAGAWLNADATSLSVAVTSTGRSAYIRAAGAQPVVVGRSAATLDAAKVRLDRNGRRAAPSAIPGWYVDVATNAVVVLARDIAAAEAFVAGSGVDRALVRVVASTETQRPIFNIRGGDKYYRDGTTSYCSVGFSVTGSAVGGFVTAGHCGAVGTTIQGFNKSPLGAVQGSSFPGNDYAWVKVNPNWTWTPQPWVNDYAGNNIVVAGKVEAPVGASTCRTGVVTGWRCGTIQAKNQTVNYIQGQVTGLTVTNACALQGDSGGSFLSGQQAQGVASGSSFGTCDQPGVSSFQPLQEILDAYGLTLVTSNAPSPSPSPTVCVGYGSTYTGSLASGGQAIVPNGTYFETTVGGLFYGCLDGPSGTDFDLFLQRWNGSSWASSGGDTGFASDKFIFGFRDPGRYRYVVKAITGSGSYTVGFTHP